MELSGGQHLGEDRFGKAGCSKELEILKRQGDRNYYEFTLLTGARPVPLSGVSLSLKKADPKHSRYTLEVEADDKKDKKIEKKDQGLNEPVQFYTANRLFSTKLSSTISRRTRS